MKKIRVTAAAIALTLVLSAGLDIGSVGDASIARRVIAQEETAAGKAPDAETGEAADGSGQPVKKTKKQLKAEKKAAKQAAKQAKKEAKRAAKEAAALEAMAKDAMALDNNIETAATPTGPDATTPGETDELAPLGGEADDELSETEENPTDTDLTDAEGEAEEGTETDEGEGAGESTGEDGTEIDLSTLSIEIKSTLGAQVMLGESIKLKAELTGFDGLVYTVQWQVNKTGCAGDWQDVPGATGLTHAYEATAESLTYAWRLAVDIA